MGMFDTIALYVDGFSVEVQVKCFANRDDRYFINATGQLCKVTENSARIIATPPTEIVTTLDGNTVFMVFRSGIFQGLRRPDNLVRLMCAMCGFELYTHDGRFHECRRG